MSRRRFALQSLGKIVNGELLLHNSIYKSKFKLKCIAYHVIASSHVYISGSHHTVPCAVATQPQIDSLHSMIDQSRLRSLFGLQVILKPNRLNSIGFYLTGTT